MPLLSPSSRSTPKVTSAFPARCRRVNQSRNNPSNRNSNDKGNGKNKRETNFFIRNIKHSLGVVRTTNNNTDMYGRNGHSLATAKATGQLYCMDSRSIPHLHLVLALWGERVYTRHSPKTCRRATWGRLRPLEALQLFNVKRSTR